MKNYRLIDTPVTKREHESLGVGMYADILAKFIMNCETPLTIGIQGDWGIGKTSMLNMVQEILAPNPRRTAAYHVIYFNTWQYSQFNQEEFLGLSILKGIMTEIQELDSLTVVKKSEAFTTAQKSFGRFVATLGNQVLKKQTGLDIQGAIGSGGQGSLLDNDIVIQLRRMKEEFSNLVKSLVVNERDRLVIMIDDLDRIKPVRALEFLEAIKNFLDVEYCVFVMAVDYSVIQSGIAEKLGSSAQELQGKSYFDKIIQVPFEMPANSYQTDKYIMSLLGWNYTNKDDGRYEQIGEDRERYFLAVRARNISKKDVEFFTNITGLTVGNNPRSIKRAVNYANLLRMVVQSQRSVASKEGSRNEWTMWDAKILYPLACMQLAWPELFVHFSNEPNPSTLSFMQDFDYLQKLNNMDSLMKRVRSPDETMSNITGFIDEFIGLIDEDGDGQVSAEEFMPIWKMVVDANLTSAKHRDIEEDWRKLSRIIINHMGNKQDPELLKKIMNLFRDDNSRWSDLRSFDLLGAGKKFFNVTWGRKQVGSIVSTQRQPIQFYIKGDWSTYCENVTEEAKPFLIDVHNVGHYGTGDTQVEIEKLAQQEDAIDLMNSIFDAMQKQLL